MLRVIPSGPGHGRALPLFEESSMPVRTVEGFYGAERDDVRDFRWMREKGSLGFEAEDATRFLELPVHSSFRDLSQELTVRAGEEAATRRLPAGWTLWSFHVPAGIDRVDLAVNKVFPRGHHPGDSRTLGVRVGTARIHRHAERHAAIAAVAGNRVLNLEEMWAGKARLESTPPHLGVDLHGVCNVKPPCVYCDWDSFKDQEGDFVDVPFTRETLAEWGPFFDNAESLVNCGIGEPFMMKNLDELLDVFGDHDKTLEMATNGQILTDRNIERLLGRKVHLNVSLDAATPETYAKLRNDTLPLILENLRRLISAKGGPGHYPHVLLVFMPMKVNRHELEDFVKLCAELDVDEMVLRPLNYSDDMGLDWERAGYRFVYEEELLSFRELAQVSGRAAELCRRYGVPLADLLDIGDAAMEEAFPEDYAAGRLEAGEAVEESVARPPAETPPPDETEEGAPVVERSAPAAAETPEAPEAILEPAEPARPESLGEPPAPICQEPWEHLYILRRGVYPCCYGHNPIEPMDRWREVWNSPKLQEIRTELTAGRLHAYCLESTSCPIVRKRLHSHRMPWRQALPIQLNAAAHRVDRLALGVPGKLYRGARWVGSRALRSLTDPAYVRGHVKRLLRRRRA